MILSNTNRSIRLRVDLGVIAIKGSIVLYNFNIRGLF